MEKNKQDWKLKIDELMHSSGIYQEDYYIEMLVEYCTPWVDYIRTFNKLTVMPHIKSTNGIVIVISRHNNSRNITIRLEPLFNFELNKVELNISTEYPASWQFPIKSETYENQNEAFNEIFIIKKLTEILASNIQFINKY